MAKSYRIVKMVSEEDTLITVERFKSRQPHDTGHLRGAVRVLEDRVIKRCWFKEEETEMKAREDSPVKYLRSARPWLLRAYLVYSVSLDTVVVGTLVWYFILK